MSTETNTIPDGLPQEALQKAREQDGDVFGFRLYRTPYLVIPRLALEAMPHDWQIKFEALLTEADEAGIKTPAYHVFRDLSDGNPDQIRGCKQVNRGQWDKRPFYRLTGGYRDDPWANYRHGDAHQLSSSSEGTA